MEESFYHIIEQCIRNTNFLLNECFSRFSASTRYAIEQNIEKKTDKIFSVCRASALCALEGQREELLHGSVVEQNPTQHRNMPQIVTSSKIIKHARAPSLGHFARIHKCAHNIHHHTLCNGRIKFPHKLTPPTQRQLHNGHKARRAQADKKSDTRPGHIGPIKRRIPRHHDAGDAQDRREDHVQPPTHGLAVKGRVLGRHDTRGDEEGDAGIIDAGKGGNEVDVGDGVHGVPDGAADEALAGGEEEDGGDEDVGFGGEVKVYGGGIEVERYGKDEEEAEGVGPDVDELVGEGKGAADAAGRGLAKAVAAEDMGVDAPWHGEIFIANQSVLLGPQHSLLNRFLQPFGGMLGPAQAILHDPSRQLGRIIDDGLQAALAELVCARFKVREHLVEQLDGYAGFVDGAVGGGESGGVAGLEGLDHDVGAAAAFAEEFGGGLGAAGADGLEGLVGAGEGGVEGEVGVGLEVCEASLEL